MNADEEAYLRQRVKVELRRRMRAVRGAIPRESRAERSAALCTRLNELDVLRTPTCVALYAAIRSEADPSAVAATLRARSVETAYPRIDEDGGLDLHTCGPESLVAGTWDIPEPPSDAPKPSTVDVIITPGLAFDPRGHRVGYGRAYYDRLFGTWPDAFRVAIGFDFQLVSETPNLPHDVPVHCIVTDKRTLMVSQ